MPTVEHGGWGRIEIQDAGQELLKSSTRGQQWTRTKEQYIWRPNAALAQRLGPTFAIKFDCYRDNAGQRRFVPVGGFQAFIQLAFQAGRAIRCERDELQHTQQVQLDILWNCYRRVQNIQEKLKRRFKYFKDLQVRGHTRGNASNVLPAGLGSTPSDPKTSWPIPQFTTHGRERALQDGIARPSETTIIQYGLLAAAERQPLVTSPQQSVAIIQLALFYFEGIEDVSPEIVDCVLNRLRRAFAQHDGDTHEEFWRWFKSNIFKTLANQIGDEYGKLALNQVRSAMLKLGWHGHRTVARCLETFALEFATDLPKPLTPEEHSVFAAAYCPQSWLGGLPLVMLLDRSELIQPVVLRMWEEPENAKWPGVFLRLLNYYDEMTTRRRPADRQAKRASTGKRGLTLQFPVVADRKRQEKRSIEDSIPQSGNDDAIMSLQHVAERLHFACSHANCDKRPKITGVKECRFGKLLELHCDAHGELPSRQVTAEELAEANPFEDS